jgi:hypothetical protein
MLKGNRKLEVDKLEVDKLEVDKLEADKLEVDKLEVHCRKEQGKNTRRERCGMKRFVLDLILDGCRIRRDKEASTENI